MAHSPGDTVHPDYEEALAPVWQQKTACSHFGRQEAEKREYQICWFLHPPFYSKPVSCSMRWYHQHSGRIFPSQVIISGNSPTCTQKSPSVMNALGIYQSNQVDKINQEGPETGHSHPYRRGWNQDEQQEEAALLLKVQSSIASSSATG